MILRVAMGVLLVLLGFLFGSGIARAQARRLRALLSMQTEIPGLRVRTLTARVPLSKALADSGDAVFSQIGRAMEDAGALEAWRQNEAGLRAKGGLLDSFEDDDLEILRSLFSGLDHAGSSEILNVLAQAETRLSEKSQSARSKCSEQGRLYRTLGALAGAAAAIAFF